MRKRQLSYKRILALALSVSMVFASTDTYVALAAEAENFEIVEDNGYQTDEAETTPDVSDGIDPISQLEMEEEADTEGDSDASGETGSSDDSDAEENSDSLTDETDEEIDNSELAEDEAVTSDVDEASEDEAQILADENAEAIMPTAEGEIAGVELDGNGDMVLDSAGNPTMLVAENTKAASVLTYCGMKLTSKDFTVGDNWKWTGPGSLTINAKSTGNSIAAPATDMEVELTNKTGYTFKSTGVIFNKDDITVKYKGNTLVYGTDYKVTCSNNKKVGDTAKYKVTFLGNYKGIRL